MNFFCTEKDFDQWTAKMNLNMDDIYKLPINEAIEVSKELFEFR